MANLRWTVTAVGALLIALAVLLVSAPELLGPITPPVQQHIELLLGNTAIALPAVGIATALVGAIIASSSGQERPTQPDLGAILGGVDSTPTGSEFDERLARLSAASDLGTREELESDLLEEVRRTAVTVLARSDGLTVDRARSSLEAGDWTDDPQAAAFFSPIGPPWRVRLREWLRPRPATEQRLERVLDQLEALMDLPSSPADDTGTANGSPQQLDELEGAVLHRVDSEAPVGTSEDRVVETRRYPPPSTEQLTEPAEVVSPRQFSLAAGLLSVAVGLVSNVTTPFLLGFLGVGYSLTKYVANTPEPEVELTRILASDSPVPGDLVEVELTVENRGESPLTDLRVIDGVPSALRVVDGSPGIATSLQPGSQASLHYTLRAKRGPFSFDEIRILTRDLSNVRERAVQVAVPTRLTGATRLNNLALKQQASQRIGAVKTDQGGSGVEFYGTREYHQGDPLSRVNWNQLAKTGELTTVQFREQRAPTVAIVLDQREEVRTAPTEAALDGVDLCVYAAEQAFLALLETGTEVGLITYGELLTDIEPASDATQRAMVQSRLRVATDRYAAALGETAIDTGGAVFQRPSPAPEMIGQHVPASAQVLVLSPATDDFALETTERLSSFGHPVTLLSPGVAGLGSVGGRQARLDRACRLAAIRDQGTRVIDWAPAEPIQLAIARLETVVT